MKTSDQIQSILWSILMSLRSAHLCFSEPYIRAADCTNEKGEILTRDFYYILDDVAGVEIHKYFRSLYHILHSFYEILQFLAYCCVHFSDILHKVEPFFL